MIDRTACTPEGLEALEALRARSEARQRRLAQDARRREERRLERVRATHDWTTGRDEGNYCGACRIHEDADEADLPCKGD